VTVNNSTRHYISIFLALATAFGLLAVSVAATFIFTSDNPVSKLAMLIGGILLLVGTIEPRRMLVVLVPITFYLDEFKRLLILLGRTSLDDVTSILAVAPMATLGILIGCIIRRIFFRRSDELVERLAVLGALAAFIAFGGMEIFTAGNLLVSLKYAANTTVYFLLPWAVLQLYRTREEIERFLKFCLVIGIPVALYGIWQYVMGLSQFEIAYLRSGLSMVGADMLADIRPRPFSTLSSVHAYSCVMMFMLALSLQFFSSWKANRRSWKGPVVTIIYAVAIALSMARSTTLASVLMIVFARLFRSKTGVTVAYSASAAFVGGMIFFAQPILDSLDKLQSYLPMDSDWQVQAFRLGTWSDRLKGYNNILANPASWPLVANPLKYDHTAQIYTDSDYHHDLFSAMILRIGILPLLMGACFALFIFWRTHRAILMLPAGKAGTRILAARLMAIIFVFFLSQTGGSGMTVFPINFWLGILVGLLAVICHYSLGTKPEKIKVGGRSVEAPTEAAAR
jgi:hypothetical protein